MDDARVRAIVQQMLDDPASLGAAQRFPSKKTDGTFPTWNANKKLWESTDLTSFLKLAAAANRQIAFGVASLTWAGAVFNSNIATVPHGLGVAPVIVVAIAQGGGTPAHFFCNVRNFTATSFDLQGNVAQPDAAPAATSQNAFWLAIG